VYALQGLLEEKQRLIVDYNKAPWTVKLDASVILMGEALEKIYEVTSITGVVMTLWSDIVVEKGPTDVTAQLDQYVSEFLSKEECPPSDNRYNSETRAVSSRLKFPASKLVHRKTL
jgi:hypothetical protein